MSAEQSNRSARIATKVISSVTYILFIILPSILEIIFFNRQNSEQNHLMITICGSLQMIIAIYSGTKLGMVWAKVIELALKKNNKEEAALCERSWCLPPSNCQSLFSVGYSIYFLVPWTIINIITSWKIVSCETTLLVYLCVYSPLIFYLLAFFGGYAYEKALQEETEPIKTIPSTVEEIK